MNVRVGRWRKLSTKELMLWTVVLEKTLESPLDCKKIQPVHPKGDQSWVFIGRTDVEAETPILWPPDVKSWLIWKDPDAGKDWGQEGKGTTEDEMAGWHHQLDGHGFGSWWWIERPGVLRLMGSQRVRHNWATELNIPMCIYLNSIYLLSLLVNLPIEDVLVASKSWKLWIQLLETFVCELLCRQNFQFMRVAFLYLKSHSSLYFSAL